jgi:hypothetical protein
MMDSHRLARVRPALLCLSLLALSCGEEKRPPVQDLPQAVLTVPQPNTVGQSLTVQVSASGCEQVESLSIYDGEDFIKSVPYSGSGGTVSVDIGANEIKYTRGIAAQLTLKARVVCTDKRQNDSLQQPATFFPVAEVIELPAGNTGQVVPDFFVADGSGVLLTFIGCGTLPNGTGRLFKVNKSGTVLASVDMPFPCTVNTVITGMDPQSRKRWVWTPDWGAIAVDEQLKRTASTVVKVDLLSVGPGGDALIWNSTGTGAGLSRLSHTGDDNFKWRYTPRGFMVTPALVNNNGVVLVASIAPDSTLGAAIIVATVDYGDQNPATGGIETNAFLVKRVASNDPVPTTTPPATFNADGTLIYLAIEGLNQLTQVFACATQANFCEGANQRWTSPVLSGSVVATVPYANGSRLAVIAPQKAWVLDASTGSVVNKGGGEQPFTTQGALITLQVQAGAGPFPHSFYFLNGAAPQEGLPSPMPVEIVGTDSADKGVLYRYQISSGTLAAAVDAAGTLWLRVGRKLARPLTPTEYRQVRPVTP